MNRYKYYYDAAVRCLNRRDYHIIGGMLKKNTIVAWDPKADALIFVKIRRHFRLKPGSRVRADDLDKRLEFRRACNVWRRSNKWHGAWRIDIIDVYGDGNSCPLIDHIISAKGYGNVKK